LRSPESLEPREQNLNESAESREQRVLEKAQEIARIIDSDLGVQLGDRTVVPDDKSKGEYQKICLVFLHSTIEGLEWSQEFETDQDYLDNKLEEVIRRIYERELSEVKQRRVLERAKEIAHKIDPDLEVKLKRVITTPDDRSKTEYEATDLWFFHATRRNLTWSQEFKTDQAYIDNELEGAIRRAYEYKNAKSNN